MPKRSHAWFTICSANYLAYAKTLFASLSQADPEAGKYFFLVLVDEALPQDIADSLDFPVILAKDLGIPEFWDMAFRYSVMEFNTAVKPAAILHLMDKGFGRVTYLDPDIYVIKPLTHVREAHEAGNALVLTPHSMKPLEDGLDPDDVRLMQTGVYNLGFASFASEPAAHDLLGWWHRRMLADCRVDLKNGLFVDQKFMDLAPAYCESTHILRHPGYNVAYWNLASRPVTRRGPKWKVGRSDLYFFHFSGVVPGNHSVFSKHQNRFGIEGIGELKGLLDEYLDAIAANGHERFSAIPYAYASYADGQHIPDVARRVYGDINSPRPLTREEAFQPDFAFLDQPADDYPRGRMPVTRVMARIWSERPDLGRSFNLADEAGREGFCRWFLQSAGREYGLPPAACQSVSDAIAALDQGASQQPAKLFSPRWMAHSAMRRASWLRGTYRMLPHGARVRIRDLIIRTASGHSLKGAQILQDDKPDPNLTSGLAIYGYLHAISGVGEGARRMAQIAAAADLSTSLHVLKAPGHASEVIALPGEKTSLASPFNCLIFHINADQLPAELDRMPPNWLKGRYRIGYWAWELSIFPETWLPALDYVHEVWVPSKFVQEAIQAKTSKPVHVVPHPVPRRRDSGESRIGFGLPVDRFLFLCSVDLKSYMARKNPLAAYEAFCRAFPDAGRESGPLLVVKLHSGPDQTTAERDMIDRLSRDRRVILIDIPLSNERYASLQRLCDAYVSLHRSEGFGMNIAESMQLGKPVVVTDYSGNRDYLTYEDGYPVRYELVEVRDGEYPEAVGQVWAEPDLDCAAELMHKIYSDPDAAAKKGYSARSRIESKYSTSTIAKTVRNHYLRIQRDYFGVSED